LGTEQSRDSFSGEGFNQKSFPEAMIVPDLKGFPVELPHSAFKLAEMEVDSWISINP